MPLATLQISDDHIFFTGSLFELQKQLFHRVFDLFIRDTLLMKESGYLRRDYDEDTH